MNSTDFNNNDEIVYLSQNPSVMVQSLKSIGYKFQDALCDIIDNSIKAKSDNIWIECLPDQSTITIRDDGYGMSYDKLVEAINVYVIDPRTPRSEDDLGKFGLGLKTASLSQCKKFTVVSKSFDSSDSSAIIFDEEFIDNGQYKMLPVLRTDPSKVKHFDKIGNQGTVVLWENLQISGLDEMNSSSEIYTEILNNAKHYIDLVFHRYLEGIETNKVKIYWNNYLIEPFNPFFPEKSQTQEPNIYHIDNGKKIKSIMTLEGFTLPAESQLSNDLWNYYSGPYHDLEKEDYMANQGFYVYRQKRLIAFGVKVHNWFGLQKPSIKFQLSRVKIDINNDLDSEWNIEWKKSELWPNSKIIPYLKRMLNPVTESSVTNHRKRGEKLLDSDPLPIWNTHIIDGETRFSIDRKQEIITDFITKLDNSELKDLFKDILHLIELKLPYKYFTNIVDELHIKSREELIDLGIHYLRYLPFSEDEIYEKIRIEFRRETDMNSTENLISQLKNMRTIKDAK